jgi:hypothetical protein
VKASSFVVYIYVVYRKEIMIRCMRSYVDRDRAIAFAESLSTKYVSNERTEEDEQEDDEYDSYTCCKGTEFDAKMKMPTNDLVKYGVSEEESRNFWYTRIAVDKVEQW